MFVFMFHVTFYLFFLLGKIECVGCCQGVLSGCQGVAGWLLCCSAMMQNATKGAVTFVKFWGEIVYCQCIEST